jgi:hypothetical protein
MRDVRRSPRRRALGGVGIVCQKRQRRCPELLRLRDAALMEWCAAETYSDVCRAWGRLGGLTTAHRYGRAHFAALARRRRLALPR